MKHHICAFALLPMIIALPLNAAPKKSQSTHVIEQSEKAQNSTYDVVILMPQTTIETSFDTGRVARPPSGGVLDSLIVHSMDNKQKIMANSLKEKAERTVAPLRTALIGFDIDALAIQTTENAISMAPWIVRDSTTLSKNSLPPPKNTRIAQIRYSYDLSPDFSALRVFAEMDFVRSSVTKDGKSNGKFASFFSQSITSIVQLRKRSYEGSENIAAWTAQEATLAKNGFTRAFGQIERLIPFALGLSEADLKSYSDKTREQGFAAGYNGTLIKRGGENADDMLIWNKGLLQVHTLP